MAWDGRGYFIIMFFMGFSGIRLRIDPSVFTIHFAISEGKILQNDLGLIEDSVMVVCRKIRMFRKPTFGFQR